MKKRIPKSEGKKKKLYSGKKLSGESLNIKQENLKKLRELFPNIFSENKLDLEKFKSVFTDDINIENERYVLNWAGKSEAFKVLQIPTTSTLVPQPDESVNFDNTENVFIEGENLEVLKVLQKSYYGRIKCIIIDPPYNTGNDSFIYPDKFKESKNEYARRTGELDEEGNLMKEGMFRKNTKDSGHFHSNWLSMMYPRLFLAKNLLKEDGVIFVHIDDNEVHNLRLIMNEIFGEENFLVQVINVSNPRGSQSSKFFAQVHEYLLVYSKNNTYFELGGYEKSEEEKEEYNLVDENKKKYRLLGLRQRGGAWKREHRPKMYYPIYVNPLCGSISLNKSELYKIEVLPKRPSGEESRWTWSKELVSKKSNLLMGKKINRSKNVNGWDIFRKDYLEKENGMTLKKPKSIWDEKEVNNQNGRNSVKELFNGEDVFDFPKSIFLPMKVLKSFDDDECIILDFFAGSGTTAQAVLELNKEDGGKRKFVLVQLPEKCDENSEAYKAGYETIADIAKERIRRAIKKIKKETEQLKLIDTKEVDLGFKVFKLSPSNFKIWRGNGIPEKELVKQLQAFTNPLKEGKKKSDILYEIILKAGYMLTDKIEDKDKYYSVKNGELVIALEEMNKKIIEKIISAKPEKVITLDILFKGKDQLKTNTALQLRDAEIEFKTI